MITLFVISVFVIAGIHADEDISDFDDKLLLTLLNPPKTSQGDSLFEGDIALPREDDNDMDNELIGRKALPNKGGLWDERVIAYEFHKSVNATTAQVIKDSMTEWEKRTCLKFTPKTNQNSYLRFRTDSEGCWTYVGRMGTNGQDVNLGPGCEHIQLATHEIGHSLGFFHEHSRRDRTSNIKILWHNIQHGMASQFQTGNDSPRGVPYDVTSIMHYSPMSFSRNMFIKNTMVSVDPHLQSLIGKNKGITFRDAKLANLLYNCDDRCPNQGNAKCQNEGYLEPYKGGNGPCPCVCPPNTKGQFCESITGTYYGLPECGYDITSEQIIETPGYPNRRKEVGSCTWKIQAPRGKKVQAEFLDFSFRARYSKPSSQFNGLCVHEHVEIRTNNMDEGDLYCGTDIKSGTKIISTGNTLLILIKADGKAEGKGLKAKVSFI